MQSSIRWLAKGGNTEDEYEDAFAENAKKGRFAVADGATESAFAAPWAQLLVEHFVRSPESDIEHWAASLPTAQQQWQERVGGRTLPWYAEMKFTQGAFATFLGVTVTDVPNQPLCWRATAVGDTCLFHTRGAQLLRAFPLRHSEEFENSPPLLGSRTPPQEICRRAVQAGGVARADDRLWLMTDALSRWLLQEYEAGRTPWEEMELLLSASAADRVFINWIEGLRQTKGLRNDDVTALVVRL